MDFSFLDIRCKEVVNIVDGRCLGHVTDIIFNMQTCVVLGFVVPASKNFWNVFKSSAEIFIPLSQIRKIGDDTILEHSNNKCLFRINASNESSKFW